MRSKRYEELDHTADLRLKVFGRDTRELFANAVFALFDRMVELGGVKSAKSHRVEAAGADAAETLVSFLGELLYHYNVERFVCRECEIEDLSDTRVRAVVRGEVFDPSRHRAKHEIKAVTFHDVRIERTGEGLEVVLTFDV